MAKASLIILVSLAICMSSSLSLVNGAASDANKFTVLGHVYCDTCRVEFETSLSEPLPGAAVKLECKNRTDEKITFQSPEITTDNLGDYKIEVTGDYEDSDCDVTLVKSPRADCNDPT
ncbi:hypothetical protein ERO13_D05G341650v2 [Gossypium hirsutum]|uniref:Pollen-specific protein-like At4g18596 n=2 Tax=Gossypium TaxID=3633 RepID=A0A1U8MZ43_GOSHI|nr:pollen-specific protein-like At4g18596 [Gossypium hirsutum]KAG4149558.1 hypothetical protein ERO13_D05G341650v2 [Gossypium hirsutum]TYH74419.1 hypothetical protein ES332_D05G397500v1 [Gossypium tomentosum]TYH74420.1 hypothetical protein ES332_D05G397500v1 [Gossypium tomentosum]